MTAADVAQAVGVSRATVGYVLNDTPGARISAQTRERVLREAARLGYQPSTAAQALARGRSRIVLVVLPDWPIEFTLRTHLEEAARVLDDAGYATITYTHHESEHAQPLWKLVDPEVVVGLVPFTPAQLRSIRAAGISRITPDPDERPDIGAVPAVVAGPRLQVRHLASLGHRALAFAASADRRHAGLAAVRRQAVEREAAALGLDVLDARAVDHRDGRLPAVLRAWLSAGVTGVVAFNDDIAGMIAGTAVRARIAVPRDLSVVGHDDTPMAAYFAPTISSVGLDSVGFGRWMARQALDLAEGRTPTADLPEPAVFLVERESTGPARPPAAGEGARPSG
ncbi:LacI family DNA-binding transcriptional regulator [Allonocardiopsis opalescens]|uniref:DNA-binding LacI/PurR family transcriptional regulator n=1 Tax=Allonocardiopsis opalescens TaxID=1144618 RepID=A0A2T0Q7J7_9ACTN|nr:LacI family DNA-binding transcriptional regulator [Allonocardiopsis opalescens]PRX99761.1 DNA-binding LacI/PurR family transcriptional regulator [Allonocardiopsis opalescens]